MDDCSRGIDAKQLLDNNRWLKGPQFLWLTEDSWPDSKIENVPDDHLEVKKETMTLATNVIIVHCKSFWKDIQAGEGCSRLLPGLINL